MLLKRPMIWCSPVPGFVIPPPVSIAIAISQSTAAASPPSGRVSQALARQVIKLDGKLLTAGWVDLHVHVFEWVTTFGLPPDDAGIHSGVTTAVDQGGAGAYTIPAFKNYIADRALTALS